jgi:hypothetical protein
MMMKLTTSMLFVFSCLSSVSYATDKIYLIDAEADVRIEELGSAVNYEFVKSSSSELNFEATFSSSSVRSVLVTFDNPSRSFCEGKKPYAVFGDTEGDFYGATIPLGKRTVNATAFPQSNCRGTAILKQSKTFDVNGCGLFFRIYDAKTDQAAFNLTAGANVTLPCKVNVEAVVKCGFEVEEVRLELLNKGTGNTVKRTEHVKPYFLFGNDNRDIYSGSIARGNYSITATIDDIKHRSLDFQVGTCRL